MKRYTIKPIFVLIITLSILAIASCTKPVRVLSILTEDVAAQDITAINVVLRGYLVDPGPDPIYNHGILIKKSSDSQFTELSEGPSPEIGTFISNFANPDPATNYEFKAFVQTNDAYFYGELKFFTSN